MRIPQSYIQKCKVAAHVAQVILIFIAGCITIAVFTKDGDNSGSTDWFFALCWLTMPALIYLVMTSMWSRTHRFANVYAFFAIDVLYAIFWFSAFISVAVWNSNGIKDGEDRAANRAKKGQTPATGCDAFDYGEPAKCELSKAAVGFGVVIFLFFAITSAISFYGVRHFRQTGQTIFIGEGAVAGGASHEPLQSDFISDPQKDVWSADVDASNHDAETGYHPPGRQATSHYGDSDDDEDLGHGRGRLNEHGFIGGNTSFDEGDAHPGRPVEWGGDIGYQGTASPDYNTSYGGAQGGRPAFTIRSPGGTQAAPSALSPTEYEEFRPAGGPYGSNY